MLPKNARTRPIDFGTVVVEPKRAVGTSLATIGEGKIGREVSSDRDRPGAGTAAAVRAGERLVRVVVHQVDAHVARPDGAEDGVHVGAVEVKQGPPVVQEGRDLADLWVEHARRCSGWSS